MRLNKKFWEERYKNDNIGWDIGTISTPLKEYIDQIENKNLKILIPGAGNGYEVEYLHLNGFKNVFVIDFAKQPLENIKNRIPSFPSDNLIEDNFFNLNASFDLILEQTFFCALNPILRDDYVTKMHSILHANGKITGLYFQFELTSDGPPFGGSKEEYLERFSKLFKIKVLKSCYNSIKPREGKELFAIFEKK